MSKTKPDFDVEKWILRKCYRLVCSINDCKDVHDFKDRAYGYRQVAQVIEELASDAGIHYKIKHMKLTRRIKK